MFIKYNKESYKDDSLEMYIYGILKSQVNQAEFASISINQLLEYNNFGRSQAQKIRKALTNLNERQVIEVYDAVNFQNTLEISNVKPSTILYLKVHEIATDKVAFIQIYTDEIRRFMSQKMKGTKANIFKQFLYLMKFVNQGENCRKISFPNISTIAEETGVSDRAVKNYTKILEEQGFLYSNILIMEKEKVKKIYSRPQHSQDVDDAIAECISNNTKKINTQKGNHQTTKSEEVQKKKEYSPTLKKPELLLEVDSRVRDNFCKYEGELNDQSIRELNKYQQNHGVEVVVKALHICMDQKRGLRNPTGFMLKALKDGNALKEAEYRITRSKEKSEQMDREDNSFQHFDYKEALREKKRKEREETGEISDFDKDTREESHHQREVQILFQQEIEQSQGTLPKFITEWQRAGFNSRDEFEKAKENERMNKLLASLQIS